MRSEPSTYELLDAIANFFEDIKVLVSDNLDNYIFSLKSEIPPEISLLEEIIDDLDNNLIPLLKGHNRFFAFVAKNSLKICIREIKLIDNYERLEKERLNEILNADGDIKELNKDLCERIKNKKIDLESNFLQQHLIKTTMAKLSIDQTKYSGYLKALEDNYPKD